MPTYEPWYMRRRPPIFCMPCVPVYVGIWTPRRCVLIVGAILFSIGLMILLGLLLTCFAIHCASVLAGLLPLALILIIVGILLFHCGWAAHLLDDGGVLSTTTTTTTTTVARDQAAEVDRNQQALFESVNIGQAQEAKQGFWQFEEKEAWQTVANPHPIQYTLLDVYRKPY